uniref:Putative secreted protein n=1 Tax=Ixodes ricinus TaxID=34613 RepID=A0A6B0UGT9_IXORI
MVLQRVILLSLSQPSLTGQEDRLGTLEVCHQLVRDCGFKGGYLGRFDEQVGLFAGRMFLVLLASGFFPRGNQEQKTILGPAPCHISGPVLQRLFFLLLVLGGRLIAV